MSKSDSSDGVIEVYVDKKQTDEKNEAVLNREVTMLIKLLEEQTKRIWVLKK